MAYAPRRDFDKGGGRGGEDGNYDVFMKAKGRRKSMRIPILRLVNYSASSRTSRRAGAGLGTASLHLAPSLAFSQPLPHNHHLPMRSPHLL